MEIPEHLRAYECSDYFSSERFSRGFYDETAYLWTFYALDDLQEHAELEFLAVGRPGCDGIEWGYRKEHPGLWAFYPTEQRFEYLAPTAAELFEGWYAGQITV